MEEKESKTPKIRLSVPFSEEVYKRIAKEAEIRGVSMPTYVAFVVGDHLANMDRTSMALASNVSGAFSKSLDRTSDYFENISPEKLGGFAKALGLELPIKK